MASSSRDVSMANSGSDGGAFNFGTKRLDGEEAADKFRSKLTHQWFDARRYPDALAKGTAQSSSTIPAVTPEMEKKWQDAIDAAKERS